MAECGCVYGCDWEGGNCDKWWWWLMPILDSFYCSLSMSRATSPESYIVPAPQWPKSCRALDRKGVCAQTLGSRSPTLVRNLDSFVLHRAHGRTSYALTRLTTPSPRNTTEPVMEQGSFDRWIPGKLRVFRVAQAIPLQLSRSRRVSCCACDKSTADSNVFEQKMEEAPKFQSFEEEARYWRDCAERLKRQWVELAKFSVPNYPAHVTPPHNVQAFQFKSFMRSLKFLFPRRDEAREELSEFYTSSKELELELETQLQQAENKAAEYRTSCNRLKLELDAERVSWLRLFLCFRSPLDSGSERVWPVIPESRDVSFSLSSPNPFVRVLLRRILNADSSRFFSFQRPLPFLVFEEYHEPWVLNYQLIF